MGNDFIPNLPSLKIREGAIDALLYIYKAILPQLDGYLTEGGNLVLSRIQLLFQKLSLVEETFFKQQLSYQAYLERKKTETNNFADKSVSLEEKKVGVKSIENNEELKIFDEIFYDNPADNTKSGIAELDELTEKDIKNKEAAKEFNKQLKELLKVSII